MTPVATTRAARSWATCSRTATTPASTTSTRSPASWWCRSAPTALERLRVLDLGDDGAVTDDHVLEMPEPVYSAWLGGNPEYDATTFRYGYTSLVSPTSAFDYDPATRTCDAGEAPAGARRTTPSSTRAGATVGDRTRRHPGPDLDRATDATAASTAPRPMLLYGYGSYEVVDRPDVLGVACEPARPRLRVRDRARPRRRRARPRWYDDGKLLHKRNTFTDFVACAEHLVATRVDVARPPRRPRRQRRRAAHGRGRRTCAPTCSGPIVAEVPFVDCLTTILDESLPLTDHRVGGVGRPGRTTRRSTRT